MDRHLPNGDTDSPEPEPIGAILLVEDDDMVRFSTARLLRRAGYDVAEAAGGEEALVYLQTNADVTDLVLSDVIMPKQNGYELGRTIRERWPEIRVVLISAYTPIAMDRHGIDTSGFHVLRKPVHDLSSEVAEILAEGSGV
jgi:two-component system, cell cycle sensor histidine kinase and response regulator CckA